MPPVQTVKLDIAASETGVGKEERAQRPVPQTRQPAGQTAVAACRQGRVGKDDRDAIALQNYLAHADQGTPITFVGQRFGTPLPQQANPESAARALAAGSQRIRFDQPGAQHGIRGLTAKVAAPTRTLAHCGRGAFSMPLRRVPGLMPRWLNQPRFISSA